MSPYIFLLYYIYHLCLTCNDFYDLSAWGGCWLVVYIRRFIYKFFKRVSFWLNGCCGLVGRWARKPVNHTSWVTVVTPTDRPKSVRNRCLIELFCGVVCVVTCPFDISVGVGLLSQDWVRSLPFSLKQIRSSNTNRSILIHEVTIEKKISKWNCMYFHIHLKIKMGIVSLLHT